MAGIDLRLFRDVSLTGGPSALPRKKEIKESDKKASTNDRRPLRWIVLVPSLRILLATSAAVSSRVLKKSVSFVLASLRGSTYRSVCLAS